MKPDKLFLSAKWENLILITYDVDPGVLEPHMPHGLELDIANGRAFVSLVAFNFIDTRVKGFKIPFHVNFPEINLRFYVKNKMKRGVIFISEFVPRLAISFIANKFYNEKYRIAKMKSSSILTNSKILLEHKILLNKKEYFIAIEADNSPYLPEINSIEHFFKEHQWGFGTSRTGKTLIYKVEHPFWEIFPVIKFDQNFDFGAIYGNQWEFLNEKQPYNIICAKGSAVKVFEGSIIHPEM
jgi:uncharacterized protein